MASNSKKRRRVLGASCILAALIIASSSFAWFTSKDEVTNRLSANADYDVKLVESFAPPANWLPGSVINKDVYATNTGTIPAYVREKVTSKIAITTEDKITVANTNGKIDPAAFPTNSLTETVLTLDEDERYSIEAGSFLAYAPTGSTNVVGRQVVVYKGEGETKYRLKASPYTVITADEYAASTDPDKATKYEAFDASKATDFQPTSEGLYVFRRVIDVANDRSELFEYVGYYYKDGQYYKVTDIAVTPDQVIDLADDGVDTDGVITAATFNLAKDVKHVAVPTLTYDSENNRLVATYGDTGTTYKYGSKTDTASTESLYGKANDLDAKEHALAEARAKMDRAFLDLGVSNANVQMYQDQVNQLEAELDAVNAKIAELTAAKTPIDTQVANLAQTTTTETNYAGSVAKAKADFENALKTLYGSGYTNAYSYTVPSADASGVTPATGSITFNENQAPYNAVNYTDHYTTPTSGSEVDSKYHAYLVAKKALDDAKTNYGDSMFNAYKNEMAAENLGGVGYITTGMSYDAAIAKLTFAQLSGFNPTTQYHDIHQKTVAFLEAKEAYEDAKTDANNKLADYLNKANRLGDTAGTITSATGGTQTIAGVTVTWDNSSVPTNEPGSGLYGEQADLAAQLATQNAKKTALEGVIATAISNRDNAVNPANGSGYTAGKTAQEEYDRLKGEYQTALNNYYSALNAYNAYKTNLETQDKKLKIYINLSDDVVTAAGEANKWQIVPVGTENLDSETDNLDTATFYYTSILKGGETSKKLIDSVELDKDTTNGMYKSFDFDLNVVLDSAQITYSDDQQKTISTTAATDEFGKTPTLYEPTNIDTAVAWPTT